MFEILKLYGILQQIIAAIKVMYIDISSTLLSTGGETPSFPIFAGILQGYTLASFLFIIVVDYFLLISVDSIFEKGYILHPRRSRRHPAVYLLMTSPW